MTRSRSPAEPDPLPGRPSEDDVTGGRGLARAAAGGAAWQGLAYVLGKALTLGSTIVLARILIPEEFGLAGLALVFVTYAEVITDLGVSQAVVYFPEDRRTHDAALTLSLLWSGVLVLGAFLAAPMVAGFFDRPDVAPLFRVVALALLVGGLGSVPDALLRKRLRFRQRLVAVLGRVVVKGVLSIALAVAGLGAWALVWGFVAGEAAWMIAAWILAGYRPGPRFWRLRRETAAPLLRYGLPAAGSAILLALVFNVDYLIVGERLGARSLGFYTIAYRVPELLILQALWVVSAVAFPVFSLVREDPERLRRGFLTATRLETGYGMAAGVGLAVVAPMLVPVVFGPQWGASVAPLQAIALYAVFGSLTKSATDLYKGLGRPGLAVTVSLVRLILVVPALLWATRFGIEGVAWAQAGTAFVAAAIAQAVATRLVGVSAASFARALVPAAAVGAGVLLGAGAVRLWLPGGDAIRLAAAVAAGSAGGIGLVLLADRTFVREVLGLVRRARRPAPPEPARRP
jgi:lipopolysaccharide exporter